MKIFIFTLLFSLKCLVPFDANAQSNEKPIGTQAGKNSGQSMADQDFKNAGKKIEGGFETAGDEMKKGFVKTGQGIKKGAETTGRAFKKTGVTIKDFFTGSKQK